MFLRKSKQKKAENIKLLGAVNISRSSFFVCRTKNGGIILRTGKEEKVQKELITRMVESNPRIREILKDFKIKPSVNTKTLKELSGGHMNETCKVALGIYSILGEKFKRNINEDAIKEASMLHDLGKVLIPSRILNKPAKLNSREREIMNTHSTLGYELLKTQNIAGDILKLVKYHHQNLAHSGYPALPMEDTVSDIGVQIISAADKYSALREARVYRRKLSRIESLLVLYREVLEGKIHKEIFNALIEYARKFDRV